MDRPIAGAVNGTVIQSAQCLYGKVIRAYDPRFYGRKDNKKKKIESTGGQRYVSQFTKRTESKSVKR